LKPRDDEGKCGCPGGGKEASTFNITEYDDDIVRLKLVRGDENNQVFIEQAKEHLDLE